MKQLLISILSTLVASENKIEVKKPNIHFKEGFRRIVAGCCFIGFICGAFSGELITALSCSVLCYLGYLCIEVLLCWIGAGFSGKKNKRTLLKEWQIKYKYWNRKCQRANKKCEENNKAALLQENKIIYNRNPFIPKGRMRRLDYIAYSFLFNFIMKIVEYDMEIHIEKISVCAYVLWVMLVITELFIVRNRIYDITLSNKKAWSFSVLMQLLALILVLVNPTLIYWMLPIGFVLMAMPSKITNNAEIKKTKVKEKSSFDIMKEMHNQNSNPPLE